MEASASIKKKAILNKEDSGFLSTSKLSPVVSQKPANNFSVFRQFGKKQPSPVLPPIQRNFDSKWRWLQAFRNKRRPLVPVQEVIHDDSFITEESTKKQEDKTETIESNKKSYLGDKLEDAANSFRNNTAPIVNKSSEFIFRASTPPPKATSEHYDICFDSPIQKLSKLTTNLDIISESEEENDEIKKTNSVGALSPIPVKASHITSPDAIVPPTRPSAPRRTFLELFHRKENKEIDPIPKLPFIRSSLMKLKKAFQFFEEPSVSNINDPYLIELENLRNMSINILTDSHSRNNFQHKDENVKMDSLAILALQMGIHDCKWSPESTSFYTPYNVSDISWAQIKKFDDDVWHVDEKDIQKLIHEIGVPGELPISERIRLEGKNIGNKKFDTNWLDDENTKNRVNRMYLDILKGNYLLPGELINNYELKEILGQGAFGFVVAAKRIRSPYHEVAIKFIFRQKVDANAWVKDQDYGYIPFECHLLRKLDHPGIIRFENLYQDSTFIFLVTELHGVEWRINNPRLSKELNPGITQLLSSNGNTSVENTRYDNNIENYSDEELLARRRTACDLFECIDLQYSRRMPEAYAHKIFIQIVDVIEYLELLGFVHRDLKDENIVIDEHYHIKFVDFGSCSRMAKKGDVLHYFNMFNGTLHFAAPEILKGQAFRGPEAEVWALGVLLYTMIYGESPFRDSDDILNLRLKFPAQDEKQLYVDLMRSIFNPDPDSRPTLKDIRKHPWMDEL